MFAYILLVHLVRLLHSDPLVLTAAKLDAAWQNLEVNRALASKVTSTMPLIPTASSCKTCQVGFSCFSVFCVCSTISC